MPYEAPQGRRVNAIAAYAPYNTPPRLRWVLHPRTLRAEDLLDFVATLKAPRRRVVVVVDNGSIHVAGLVRRRLRALRRRGIELFYLPGYSPKLNEIEPLFGVVKYYEMPERTYATLGRLFEAIETGFARVAARLEK